MLFRSVFRWSSVARSAATGHLGLDDLPELERVLEAVAAERLEQVNECARSAAQFGVVTTPPSLAPAAR
jgi:hypothetical protein